MERGGLSGAVFNAAKERALGSFHRTRRIGFLQMADIVEAVLDRFEASNGLIDAPLTLDNVTANGPFGTYNGLTTPSSNEQDRILDVLSLIPQFGNLLFTIIAFVIALVCDCRGA